MYLLEKLGKLYIVEKENGCLNWNCNLIKASLSTGCSNLKHTLKAGSLNNTWIQFIGFSMLLICKERVQVFNIPVSNAKINFWKQNIKLIIREKWDMQWESLKLSRNKRDQCFSIGNVAFPFPLKLIQESRKIFFYWRKSSLDICISISWRNYLCRINSGLRILLNIIICNQHYASNKYYIAKVVS